MGLSVLQMIYGYFTILFSILPERSQLVPDHKLQLLHGAAVNTLQRRNAFIHLSADIFITLPASAGVYHFLFQRMRHSLLRITVSTIKAEPITKEA